MGGGGGAAIQEVKMKSAGIKGVTNALRLCYDCVTTVTYSLLFKIEFVIRNEYFFFGLLITF